MSKLSMTVVSTPEAPSAIGPYSQAIKTETGFLFLSGQVPFDPKTMTIVEGGVEAQTEQVMNNIKAVLKAESCDLTNVVKVTVFIKSMDDFAAINGVYAKHFGDHKPARSCVEVARLPKDALVEIEVLAMWK